MPTTPPTRLRGVLPYAAGIALLILAVFSLSSLADHEEEVRRAMERQLAENLAERISVFESALLAELDVMVASASEPQADLPELQRMWRRQHPWFDALYVWSAEPGGPAGSAIRFVHPVGAPAATPPANLCTRTAREAAALQLPPPAITLLYVARCRSRPPAEQALAATETAELLRMQGFPMDALRVFALADVDDEAPLRATPEVGVALRVSRRLLLAVLAADVGERARADRLRRTTVAEILGLDAPELESTLFLVPGVLDALAASGADVRSLRARLALGEQRLGAYREIRQIAARPSTNHASEAARFSWDQYSDTPFLLYLRRHDSGTAGVALQLRQDALLRTFLARGARLADQIVISDLSGAPVAGATGKPLSPIGAPFAETLKHLRASLTDDAVAARVVPGGKVANLAIAATTLLCVLLGLGAIWEQAQANRRQHLLLQRQRDFTARVTHELKTPLAGIRVMAENLAAGAFRDASQREEMADRIVDEADRLTQRVEEILQVAKKRELPTAEPIDLEDLLLELLDVWGPRYDQAGITLHADLAPLDPVLGERRALRDAVSCLLDNALKYRREDIPSSVWLTTREEDRWAEIEVLDNGIGVPPGQRTSIFERFVRVEGPGRGKAGGHGLGLAQVAEITAQHKGTVRCEEGVDGGSRFVVRLPLARPT